MSRKEYTQIFVHPEFKKKLKKESADLNISMIEYSKLISEKEFVEVPFSKKKKKSIWDLGF